MLVPPLLVASFLFVGLLLFGLAFLLSRPVPASPELRFAAVVTGVLGVVSLAFAVLLWSESRFNEDPGQVPVSTYAESSTGSSGDEP